MADKVYKTHIQQIRILRSRGMEIKKGYEGSKTMRVLERENYYSVINGYKEPFIVCGRSPETFIPKTKFDELYSVFTFDRNIRSIYLKFILKAEHQIKTVIAHEFSKLYGHDNYLKLDNFDSSTNEKIKNVLETIKRIQTALSNQMGKSNEITHYMSTYGYVPLWVLVNILTLGEMSYFYLNMKPHDKNEVAKQFKIKPYEMSKYMKNLTLARNLCAHDERFYDLQYKVSIAPTAIHNFSVFQIPAPNICSLDNCSLGQIHSVKLCGSKHGQIVFHNPHSLTLLYFLRSRHRLVACTNSSAATVCTVFRHIKITSVFCSGLIPCLNRNFCV